tara:strand:+ start:616 stop:852 length:237 start_codon:yes stop_codon:yes gene_type:complete
MKRVRKLTPSTLKRIIAEEKLKLKKLQRSKKRMSRDQIVESYIKVLKLLNETRVKKSNELKKIARAKKIIKQKLLKRL